MLEYEGDLGFSDLSAPDDTTEFESLLGAETENEFVRSDKQHWCTLRRFCINFFLFLICPLVFLSTLQWEGDKKHHVALVETVKRSVSLQNGVIDYMASDLFDVSLPLIFPPEKISEVEDKVASAESDLCKESFFRCDFYFASDTDNGRKVDKTKYCTAFVCKDMDVKIAVYPETCSGNNHVSISRIQHDVYYMSPLSYTCSDTGCGECSMTQLKTEESALFAFLQGCAGTNACYGQIEVSITPIVHKHGGTSPFLSLSNGASAHHPSSISNKLARIFLAGSAVPKFRGGPGNQGYYASSTAVAFTANWRARFNGGIKTSVVIDTRNGTLFFGCEDQHVYALSKDGTVMWAFKTQGRVVSTPALSSSRLLYVGSEDSFLYAISIDTGTLKWRIQLGARIHASPALGIDGMIYIGGLGGCLYAIGTDGSLLWVYSTAERKLKKGVVITDVLSTSPHTIGKGFAGAGVVSQAGGLAVTSAAVSPIDGTIFFGCEDGHVYAISPQGQLRFAFKTGQAVFSTPALSVDYLTLFVGSDDGFLYSISAESGVLKYRFKAGGRVRAAPCVSRDGSIYLTTEYSQTQAEAGSGDLPNVFALSSHGTGAEVMWRIKLSGRALSAPTLSANGVLIIGTDDRYLYNIAAETGKVLYEIKFTGNVFASATIDDDGLVYVGMVEPTSHAMVHPKPSPSSSVYSFGPKSAVDAGAGTDFTDKKAPVEESFSRDDRWSCGDEVEKISQSILCNHNETISVNGTVYRCLPGIDKYIGVGVDISYSLSDPRFLRRRIYSPSTLGRVARLHGVDVVFPSARRFSITEQSSDIFTLIDKRLTNSARSYSISEFAGLAVEGSCELYPSSKVPSSTTLTSFVNASSVQSEEYRTVASLSKRRRVRLSATATLAVVRYRLLRQDTGDGQSCSDSFVERISKLPDFYDSTMYQKFLEDFGTHIMVGADIGAAVRVSVDIPACSLKSRYPVTKDALHAFLSATKEALFNSSRAPVSFLDNEVNIDSCSSRTARHAIAASKYKRRHLSGSKTVNYSAFMPDHYTSALNLTELFIARDALLCPLAPELIPIWSVAPRTSAVHHHLSAAVTEYLRAVTARTDASLSAAEKQVAACLGKLK